MNKEDTVKQILYLCNNTTCLGLDEDPLEVVLNWISEQEREDIKNKLEQLYIKDLLNSQDSTVIDVGILNNGTYKVSYEDGTDKIFEAGYVDDILHQTCWRKLGNDGFYRREIK